MKCIRKGFRGAVWISAAAILPFLGMPKSARSAPVSAAVTSSSSTMPTSENPYCAPGDRWTGVTSDGPAELPHGCVYTGLDGSPSPGKVISVAAGGNVVSTVKAASCGDTIQLQQGASFTLKGGTFPSKHCDSAHWITVRTSAADSALPAESARINPSYAGVASLSGRPPFSGPNKNVMAKLLVSQLSPIQIGDHYRLIGLEITRPHDGNYYGALVQFAGSHIILDRNWIHGDPTADTPHLVQTLAGSDHVAIINSYMTDAHCKASPAACSDAQDWSDGGHGTFMKAYNNFMEASGESIMFGGAAAAIITSDVEIRLNHLFKPLTWNPLDKTFFGTRFTVKNNFELKEGQRILVEGNIMENTWGGFTQTGANILVTPKNQSGRRGNVCPICFVSDVTLRYNYVVHGSQGLQLANGPSDNGGWSLGGHHYSIHDLIFDGMQYAECYGCGNFLTMLSSDYQSYGAPPAAEVMHDIWLDHLTTVNTGFVATGKTATAFMLMSGPPAGNRTATPQIDNLQFTNSIGDAGTGGAYPTGGGSDNCSESQKTVADMVTACWVGASSFTANLLVIDHTTSPLVFPNGNFTTSAWTKVGFVNFNGGDGGDYHLQQSSPYHGAGTDGKDLGADIDLVNSAKSFAE